jgi:hypothetical protein
MDGRRDGASMEIGWNRNGIELIGFLLLIYLGKQVEFERRQLCEVCGR